MKSDSKIIIIDDQFNPDDDPTYIVLKEKYADVLTFVSSVEAMKELPKYLDDKIIILLDLSFPSKEPDGHKVLEKIREENKLIPVIIWSAVNENEESFSDLINNDAFGFLKRDVSTKEILTKLEEADIYLNSSVSGALENWIKSHPQGDQDKPYIISVDETELTLNDLLKEVRLQTKLGQSFSKKLNKLTIDLLLRKKENLDD
ncbi:MAG: response regulator [Cyclobacteriaceae bacterium]|nr:response regulator [Cyclobacteriaceae bacterium]